MSGTPPDFLTAFYAASLPVTNGEANEAEVAVEWCDGERSWSLTATLRRYDPEHIQAVAE